MDPAGSKSTFGVIFFFSNLEFRKISQMARKLSSIGASIYKKSGNGIRIFFFFFEYIFSPRGLSPIMDSTYLYATPKGPIAFSH
jgi:hypothetical protein